MEPRHQSAILVHAFDRYSEFERFLDSFSKITGPELIAVLGPRADFERATRREQDRVTLLYQDQFWKSRALQTALQHTTADIIILTDIDCNITQSWLDQLLEPILREGESVVTGPSLPVGSHPFLDYQRAHDLELIANRGRYVDGIFGRNTALRRSVLDDIGGFSSQIRTGDDYWLGTVLLRAGYRLRFTNNPIESRYETSPWAYVKQQSRWLRNILFIGALQKRDQELTAAYRTVGVSCLLLASILAGFSHWLLALPAIIIFGWGLWRRERRIYKTGPHWGAALRAPWYQCLDHLARILALFRFLIPALRNRW